MTLKWTREIPKAPGYYLRVNAGHGVTMHHVAELDGVLRIAWGDTLIRSNRPDWEGKLTGWQWLGPIPEPDLRLKTLVDVVKKKRSTR